MTDDAKLCAQAILDLRSELLRLIKYEGMANDEATNKMYQKTTDALFAASRIIAAPAAPRADAATAGASIYERFDTWMKGPHARVQTMLEAFAAGASNERADAEKDAALTALAGLVHVYVGICRDSGIDPGMNTQYRNASAILTARDTWNDKEPQP